MKLFRNLCSIVAVLALITGLVPTFRVNAAALADGLVGYWNFDQGIGVTADEPVNGYDGVINGGAAWTASNLVVGSTYNLDFDGVDDHVNVPDTADLDPGSAITVSGWIWLDSLTQPATVAGKWYDLTSDGRGYLLTVATDGTPRFYISTTGADFFSADGSALSTGGWNHLVGTYDGSNVKLYVNGALAGTTAASGTIFANNEPLLIGANDGYGVSRNFTDGQVDEVRIYNRALSDAEVLALHNYLFTVDLTPETDTNPVGTDHTVTATLTPALSHIPVLFEVGGANFAVGFPYVYTNGSGQASHTYTGNNAGLDTITGCIDVSDVINGGVCDAPFDEPSDTASKEWIATHVVSGTKYQDSDADGTLDGDEDGLENWTVFVDLNDNMILDLGEVSTLTAADGTYELNLEDGTWSVCEVLQAGWVQTDPGTPQAPACHEVVVDGADVAGNDFGNVHLVPTSGHSHGFWGNKNGKALLEDGGGAASELALLSGLNLVNKNGSAFNPTTYAQLKTWLSQATSTNMAYMLSVQLAAAELSVEAGVLSNSTLIYAPALLPYAPIPGLSATGFISVGDLMAAADAALLADGNTPSGDPNRAYQGVLKDLLDAIVNGAAIAVEP